jgi:GNAT superfamily N-acetyltransferase
MSVTIREARSDETEQLIPLLLEAEKSERALRWGLAHLVDTVYRMDDRGALVGVATMQWHDDSGEIMELAIAPEHQRQGLGRQLVSWLADEARRRGKCRMLVGTANSSIGNIIFYQKCGFRMAHVRQDYFWYYNPPIYENGIRVQDMLVFQFDLTPH